MKYRKRPVVVDAVQFKGGRASDAELFAQPHSLYSANEEALFIMTREGIMRADPNDWVIRGVNGEFYPCKDDVFQKTYEPAES